MNNEISNCFHKTVIITRAVSGSGKTTLVRCIIDGLKQHGLTVGSHSTDDYFMKDGKYVFDKEKLSENHARNLAEFKNDIKAGIDVVICDNMNLLPWQPQPYTEAARKHRYRIIYLNLLPRTLEEHLAAQAVTAEKPDAHGLTKDLLERFIREFNDYNDLLDKNTIRDPKRHQVFVWNDFDKVAVPTGDIAPYFDCDDVITISPEDYHSAKETLASDVFAKLTKPVPSDTDAKKHYLLTWYGSADLRSALKLESGGPISNALQTGKYTDVIILCHTSPNKKIDHTTKNLQQECEKLYNRTFEDNRSYPLKDAKSLIDAVCNTDYAHRLFLDFIESLNLPIKVHFIPQILLHLHDAQGIYEGVKLAINKALTDPESKTLTCHLSPGTSLMAYTWATVSKENPHLRLRIIASSNPSKPPEEIILPDIQPLPMLSDTPTLPDDFDVMIHLLGTDTNLRQCFTMIQYPIKTQYIIKSNAAPEKFIEAFRRHFLPKDSNIKIETVDPFNTNHTYNAVESIVASLPKSTKIGVNVTGGTKLMFAGAIKACSKFANVEPIYFETNEHSFKFIKQNTQTAFKGVPSVESFFLANGFSVADKGYWQDNPNRDGRRELTKALWENRGIIAHIYTNEQTYKKYTNQVNKKLKKDEPIDGISLDIEKFNISIKYDGCVNAAITLKGQLFESQFEPEEFFHYIGGGWLEEFAYMHYESRLKTGEIKDLRIGFKINAPNPDKNEKNVDNTNPHNIYGEFDCVYTDGKRLYIVECKAGMLKQEHIQKLENNVRNYGSIEPKGELFLSLKTNRNNIHRIENSKFVSIAQFCFRENDKKKQTNRVKH